MLFSVRAGTEGFLVERYRNYILIGGHKETVTKSLLLPWPLFPHSSVCIDHPDAILETFGLSCDLVFSLVPVEGQELQKPVKTGGRNILGLSG